MNFHSGITLIALVVIIIVLLIIASISVSILSGDNGIIKKSKESKEQHEIAGERETLKLAVSEAFTEDVKNSKSKTTKVTTRTLENVLKGYDEISDVEESDEGEGVDATFKDSGRTYFVDTDGNVTETETDSSDKNKFKDNKNWTYTDSNGKTVMIGDYVSFDPKEGNPESANIFYSDRWQVLGIDSKGELELISTASISSNSSTVGLTLSGSDGYLTGVEQLNNICAPYGKGTYAKSARSVNIDDINNITGYNPEQAKYGEGQVYEYGNKVKYTMNSDGYIHYVSENGKEPSSDTRSIFYNKFKYFSGEKLDNNEIITLNKGESVSIISNYYGYNFSSLSESQESTDMKGGINGDISKGALAAKELLLGKYYWIATKKITCERSGKWRISNIWIKKY